MLDRVLELFHYALDGGAPFALLHLCTLAARERISLSFFGNRDFAAKLERGLALLRHKPRKLTPACLRCRAATVCFVPRSFRRRNVFFRGRRLTAKLRNSCLETRELITPCIHLARGKRDIDGESPAHKLDVLFCTATLAC
jgi:hypothetical protein